MVDEDDAVESLKSLGLSEYEAKVFIALQRLGVGTARDIYRLTDVPRSQVYGAAESLEERGLVEIQQSKPMEYRPVTLDEAKSRLQERFEEEQDRAFDYLENAREESEGGGEEREDFWTVKGRETIDTRVESLLDGAESRIIYNTTDADLVDETVVERLEEKAHEGVTVFVLSSDPDAREMFEGTSEEITVLRTPEKIQRDDVGGRFVMVDSDTVLLSVLGEEELPGIKKETAIWSSDTSFAAVLIQLTEGWLGEALDI